MPWLRRALLRMCIFTECLAAHFAQIKPGDYFALLAYIERNAAHIDALEAVRLMVRDRKHVATCVGFGPRFLHSTGTGLQGWPQQRRVSARVTLR